MLDSIHKNMAAFTFVNPEWAMSEIDVVIGGPMDYRKASRKTKRIRVQNTTIPVLSVEDLILMKRGTGRKHDQADIRYLKEAGRETCPRQRF